MLDYTQTDVTRERDRYDLILDTGAHRFVGRYRRILRPGGTYVMVGGAVRHPFETLVVGGWQSVTGGPRMEVLMSALPLRGIDAPGAGATPPSRAGP